MKNLPFKYFSCALTFSLALLASSNAHATSQTWTGSTGSTDWNAGANWGGTLPVSGDSFTFGSANASSSTTLTDTFANGFSVSGFTFTSGALAYTMTGNSITLTGNVTNSSTALETINNAIAMTAVRTFTTTAGGGNITLGGVVSGARGGIAVAGGGTLTLSNAANTFTGGASVSTGTLVLANGSGFASTNAFTVGAGGTLQVGNAASATNISSVDLIFSGTGSVTDGTSGKGATLTLSSVLNGTSAGAIQIASGATGTIGSGVTIALSSASSHGAEISSTVPTAAGGTLDISGALTDTGTIASNGVTVNIESGGSITAGNYFMQYFQGAVLPTALNVLDGGSLTVTGTGALELNTGQGTTDTLTVGSGVGATATVTTPNLYVGFGNTGVKNGKVVLNTGGLIITGDVGDTGGTVIGTGNNFYFNGGILRASAFPTAPASGISNFFGNIDIAYIGGNNGLNGATIDSDGHNITIAQALVTEAGVTGDSLTNTTGSVDGGVIFTDTGASAVTTLTGASTYNGGTQITGGTVLSDNAKGLGATTGSLAINSGGVLDIDNIAQTVGATTLGLANGTTGGTIQSTGGTKTLTTSGVTVNGAGNTIASSAIVIGNTTLNANSALADNGAITGTVSVGSGATLSGSGSVSSTTGVTGGTINGSGLTLTGQTSFTSGSNTLSGTETATGGVAISGTASVAQTGTLTGSVNVTSSANSTFAGVIAGAGSTLTLDNSSATVTLTGDNTYGGGTTVTAGTLAVGDASGSGTLGTGSLTLDGTLDLESNGGVGITGQTPATSSLVVGGLNGSGTITNLYTDGNAYDSSITVGAGNASGSFSGQILDGTNPGGASEFTSFTKEGTGTQTLSGNSAYSNGTIITGGVLSIASENNIGNTGGYFAAVDGTPGLNLGGGELQTTGTSTTITENVTLDAATTNTLAAATGTSATYTGVISDASTTAAGALTIGDSFGDNGSVTVTNFNTYTGGTTVNSGTFYVNSASGGTGTGAITVNGGQLAGSGTIRTSAGLTINGGGSLASGVAQSATSRAVDGTHLTIDSTAVTIGGLTGTANLTFALGAGTSGINGSTASSSFDYSNPNNNTTYLKLTGSTTINFAGSTSITLVDLTNTLGNNGSLAMRVGSPYLLAQAASNTSYLNLVIFNGTSYSLSQFDGTVNGIVEGVYDGSSAASSSLSSAYLAANVQGISISQLEADGATGIGAGAGGEYQGAFLVLNNGDLEVVPEPGTWALMLGGLALLIIIQRRRNQQS